MNIDAALPNVTLRSVTPDDIPMLFGLRRNLCLQSLLLTVPDKLDDASLMTWIERRHSEPGGMFRIIQDDVTSEAVGYTQITQVHHRNKCGYGGLLLVTKARGRGLGKATLNSLMKCAKFELGLTKLMAEVRIDNTESFRLHTSMRYRVVGTMERNFRDRCEQSYDTVLMERLLTEV